jgi:DNA-binding NarL/FixJ family response regulator
MRILIVDDEPLILRAVKRTLFDLEGVHHFVTAESGEAALTLLEAGPCDLAIVDLRMPGMSGVELLTLIRARWPETVRIVLSGYADAETVKEAKSIAHQFLPKPCGSQALRDAIAGAQVIHASHAAK